MTRTLNVPAAYQYQNSTELSSTPPTTDPRMAGELEFGSSWDLDTRHFQ